MTDATSGNPEREREGERERERLGEGRERGRERERAKRESKSQERERGQERPIRVITAKPHLKESAISLISSAEIAQTIPLPLCNPDYKYLTQENSFRVVTQIRLKIHISSLI